jgi:hypothetical protein
MNPFTKYLVVMIIILAAVCDRISVTLYLLSSFCGLVCGAALEYGDLGVGSWELKGFDQYIYFRLFP